MNVGILATECPYFYIRAFLMPVFVKEMDFPSAFGFVPWRHHVEIVTKSKTIEESWSRSILIDNMQEYKRMVSVVKEEDEEATASFCKAVLSTERWFQETQKHRIK